MAYYSVTITCGSDVTGFDAVRVGRGMPRVPVPFYGGGGTPHGRGSFAERTVSGGRLSGRGKGVAKQAGVATRGPSFTVCTKKRCWYLVAPEPFGDGVRDLEECSGRVSEESAARTYCLSGRIWTLLALPVPVGSGRCFRFRGERKEGARKAGWPGFPHSGKERARKKGESGKAGVPSPWEGTGQEEKGKAGKPGFPRNGRERARKKGRKRESRGSLAVGGNGPGRNGKRESRGSLAMGGNGPGRTGESGKAGVPSQWEGTGQEERRKRVVG
jgi:hypothetical protein